MSNLEDHTESRNEPFIRTTGVDCSNSVNHDRLHDAVDKAFDWKVLLSKMIWRLQVQSQQPVRLTRNIYDYLTLVSGGLTSTT